MGNVCRIREELGKQGKRGVEGLEIGISGRQQVCPGRMAVDSVGLE